MSGRYDVPIDPSISLKEAFRRMHRKEPRPPQTAKPKPEKVKPPKRTRGREVCESKIRYPSKAYAEAVFHLSRFEGQKAYRCRWCRGWHSTTKKT